MRAIEFNYIQREEHEPAPLYVVEDELITCKNYYCDKILTPLNAHKDCEICIECYLQEKQWFKEMGEDYINEHNLKFDE